ncbi:hypothetical protein N302_11771, partial [Corvus brachyrhynchos]
GQGWSWKCRDVLCAHSRAHSANHCSHRARCSSVSSLLPSLPASSSPAARLASRPSSSSSFCVPLSLSSWMMSSSRWVTCWGTQLLSMALTKGSGAHTSISSLPVGMRR